MQWSRPPRSGAPGDRPPVAVAEQQVGRRPGKEGEPVGGDSVGQDGQDGIAGADAGQDQQAAEAGLHDAQPARGEREQRDDAGGGVGQQHQGGLRAGSGGAKGGQQTAVVEAKAADRQHHRLPPVRAQHRPDRVAFGQQSLIQAGHRPTAAGDPVPQALRHAPEGGQRPVSAQHDHPEDRVQDERGDPEQGGMDEPPADRHPGQYGGQRKDGQRQQAADLEQRERGKTADRGVGVEPRGGEHMELDGGARRTAAGQAAGDRVARKPGGDHGEPALGAQRQPLQGEVAGERHQLGSQADREPDRVQRRQPRPGPQHRDELGQHQVEGRASHRDGQRPHDDSLPGQRARLSGVDRGGLRRHRSGPPGVDGLPAGVLTIPASRHVIHPSRDPGLETNGSFLRQAPAYMRRPAPRSPGAGLAVQGPLDALDTPAGRCLGRRPARIAGNDSTGWSRTAAHRAAGRRSRSPRITTLSAHGDHVRHERP